jgi:hypothetical protein
MSQSEGIYIFCSIQSEEKDLDFNDVTIEGIDRHVFAIPYKDAVMVAAEVPMKIYHPNKENLMAHQKVISDVMTKHDTVIPISFGNVFHSTEDVKVLTENLYPQFKQLFPAIKGKIELGLKVIGKKEWLEEEINKNPEVEKKKQTVQGKSQNAGYYDRIQLGGLAQKFFKDLQEEMKLEIFNPLEELSASAKANEPIGETMLLNTAFLIDRDDEQLFDKKINQLHDKWKDKVDFKYSGPWPAYNFINIKLKVEEGA